MILPCLCRGNARSQEAQLQLETGRPKLDIDRLALDLLDRGSGTDSYGWIELRQLVGSVDMPSIHFYYK